LKKRLRIEFPFSFSEDHLSFLKEKIEGVVSESDELVKQLPIISAAVGGSDPPTLAISLLSYERVHLFKFFYDILYNWLLPYQTIGAPLLFTVDFAVPDLYPPRVVNSHSDHAKAPGLDDRKSVHISNIDRLAIVQPRELSRGQNGDFQLEGGINLKLTFCEMVASFESVEAREEALKNLSYLKGQIALGAGSSLFARKLLETNGISLDQKSVTINGYVHQIIKRFPEKFDVTFFQEINYALMGMSDAFKEVRVAPHLIRLVVVSYLFKKQIEEEVAGTKDKRVLKVNLFHVKLGAKDKKKPVLAVAVGVNFLDSREFLEERHLLKAIQYYLPQARLVPGSFFTSRKEASRSQFLYLEVEKACNDAFSPADLSLLRKELPSDLNDRVEKLIPPVFMPKNEEEMMRNMLQVAAEVRHVSDLPHALVSFQEQTQEELLFDVLIAKVSGSKGRSFYDIFEEEAPMVSFKIETIKKMGVVKNRFPKEVCYLRARLPKEQFLRKDLSVDLYKARGRLVKELKLVLGNFRDLNGGMMAKEKELMQEIINLIGSEETRDDFLLENFYFSLQPIRMRTLVDPRHMVSLYKGMTESLRVGEVGFKILEENPLIAVLHQEAGGKDVQNILNTLGFSPQECLSASLKKDNFEAVGLFIENVRCEKKTALLRQLKK